MEFKSFDELQSLFVDEESGAIETVDKSKFRNYSKSIALTVAYLLGVREEQLIHLKDDTVEWEPFWGKLQKNENALVIRTLNNIRSNLMLQFKNVSRGTRVTSENYQPLDKMAFFEQDFKTLNRLEIRLYVPGNDINEYLRRIQAEIDRRIDSVKALFPAWVEFKHIRLMFTMPRDVETESKKFQHNQNFYPYKRYFYWVYPEEVGNILITDERLLTLAYSNGGETFMDRQRVVDASDHVRKSIKEFIAQGEKIQFFVDGENISPYSLASALESLGQEELSKIDKIIVYCDAVHSPRAWKMLNSFFTNMRVEIIAVNRIMEEKSLVDHKIVAGVTRAFYADGVDSFILASSDSDFWSVIEDTKANFLVMVERENCGYSFREIMRNNNVFYCYLDSFRTSQEDKLFRAVLRHELDEVIEKTFPTVNAKNILSQALWQSRREVSDGVFDELFNTYIKNLRLKIERDGTICVMLPEM